MSLDRRFDIEITDQAVKAADELLKHKEVRSIVIVIDWNLPEEAARGLPVGVCKGTSDSGPVDQGIGMHTQTIRMATLLGRQLTDEFMNIWANLKKERDAKSGTGS